MQHPSGIPEKIVRKVVALATFYRIFGDVRPSGEIIDLLRANPSWTRSVLENRSIG